MTYRIEFLSSAEREFSMLPPEVKRRVDAGIQALVENPFPKPPKSIPLHGKHKGLFRLRVGNYRVIYRVERWRVVVVVVQVVHRREACRR